MAQTLAILRNAIGLIDLAAIAHAYFASGSTDQYTLAKNGEWEAAATANPYTILYGACRGDHVEIVRFAIDKGADHWNGGLWNACRGGHIELARLMISKGADDWNHGLRGACYGGHIELVRLMIDKGATACGCGRSVCAHLQS